MKSREKIYAARQELCESLERFDDSFDFGRDDIETAKAIFADAAWLLQCVREAVSGKVKR